MEIISLPASLNKKITRYEKDCNTTNDDAKHADRG